MHFALPPRKTSFPPPYARGAARKSANQRKQLQYLGYLVLATLSIYLILTLFPSLSAEEDDGTIPEDSEVVIVTVFDESSMNENYIRMIKANRDDYAARHGYKTHYTNVSTYAHLTEPSPTSWALIPALRNALTLYPTSQYLWSLSPHALITNPSLSIHSHIFSRLPSLMLKDIPVVPPDSVIHTFSHLKPSQAHLILTQDLDNIAHTSFLLRNTDTISVPSGQPKDSWSQYLLDAWFDPLYRTYAFQKAENHALEHIVQWHPTILAKLVIIEQRLLNSYNFQGSVQADPQLGVEKAHDSMWQSGDLLVNFKGCTDSKERDCEKEMRVYYKTWQQEVQRLEQGKDPDGELQKDEKVVQEQAKEAKD